MRNAPRKTIDLDKIINLKYLNISMKCTDVLNYKNKNKELFIKYFGMSRETLVLILNKHETRTEISKPLALALFTALKYHPKGDECLILYNKLSDSNIKPESWDYFIKTIIEY